ncbi:MAG: nucleoside triphosphate pyrophosphohydrolase [Bosea sp.]|jgi:ATP diphosphatase|nr:nucleoside triphosphate pyrophosphohydrolase [Bosea sp. (in: a-proteobacteria)]
MKPGRDIESLLAVMAALRTPGAGCPWDLEQDFASIAPYTIEEAYEVADAIERGDMPDLREELGDLLLQVVFHARMAEEEGLFDFADVVEAINAKMIRRHPHVFGERRTWTPEEVKASWRRIKAEEKAERAAQRQKAGPGNPEPGLLADISAAMPPLARAVKLQARAGTVGFDWNDPLAVLAKMREEIDEIEAALKTGQRDAIADETGDMLFAIANLARHLGIDPDRAVAGANAKFMRRFAFIERALAARGATPATASLEEMDALWNAAKDAETSSAADARS